METELLNRSTQLRGEKYEEIFICGSFISYYSRFGD